MEDPRLLLAGLRQLHQHLSSAHLEKPSQHAIEIVKLGPAIEKTIACSTYI